jgi:hypothetical protein
MPVIPHLVDRGFVKVGIRKVAVDILPHRKGFPLGEKIIDDGEPLAKTLDHSAPPIAAWNVNVAILRNRCRNVGHRTQEGVE